jgi:hypothetical protein
MKLERRTSNQRAIREKKRGMEKGDNGNSKA